jgi:hypothetical protein
MSLSGRENFKAAQHPGMDLSSFFYIYLRVGGKKKQSALKI